MPLARAQWRGGHHAVVDWDLRHVCAHAGCRAARAYVSGRASRELTGLRALSMLLALCCKLIKADQAWFIAYLPGRQLVPPACKLTFQAIVLASRAQVR